jgi:hypothetical protein
VKAHLFYTFLVIFAATSVVTLLGVTSVLTIRDGYLTALVSAFLIELAGAVIAIFKGADFFASEKNQIAGEEQIRESIRKLDTAFGHLYDSLKAQAIHFESRLLVSQHQTPTPRTDITVLVHQIENNVGKISPEAIKDALGAITDVLEADVRIGSSEKAKLVSLCKSLPTEFAGESSRLLQVLEAKIPNTTLEATPINRE